MKSIKKYRDSKDKNTKSEEAMAPYTTRKKLLTLKDFTIHDFKRIAAKVDFTQKEWADILHISERTLQRYFHDNGFFNMGVIDRILQINKVFERGKEVFGSYERFNRWLREKPVMLEGPISPESLSNFDGINNVLTQIGRIEHGILA